MELKQLKGTDTDPNSLLPEATKKEFEVVDWNFGPLVHQPNLAHLGKPNGRICLTDLDPVYAGKLVDAGFKYLKRREVKATKAVADATPEKAGK
jgi:hypothetical protein